MFQGELVGALDNVPELDSVVTTGTCENIVGVGMERDVANFPGRNEQTQE